jgi:hypothetical protein
MTCSNTITEEEFCHMFNNTREATASSPSGIHVGHYKIATQIPKLCTILTKMMSIPFQHNFPPERWQKSTHFMIEKIKGSPKINKLRIIQLIEADFNAALKIKIGRQ